MGKREVGVIRNASHCAPRITMSQIAQNTCLKEGSDLESGPNFFKDLY